MNILIEWIAEEEHWMNNQIEWTFEIRYWIEYWIESFLGPIQRLIESSKSIEHPYLEVANAWNNKMSHTYATFDTLGSLGRGFSTELEELTF